MTGLRRELETPFALFESLRLHRFGPHDPTFRLSRDEARRAQLTPDGPGVLRIRRLDPFTFELGAEGPGGPFLLDHADDWLGTRDRPETFVPPHRRLDELRRRLRGFRLIRTPTVFEVFVLVVLQQRVSWRDAARSFRAIVRRHGEPMGGEVFVMPPPSIWKRMSLEEYRSFEVDGQRARALKAGAGSVRRLEEIRGMGRAEAEARLLAFPGVGPWTAQYVMGFARGEADAVPLGDYDLPRLVGSVLAGEPRCDDARMVELLEPYRGHRFRVIRLLQESGLPTPRFGPRRPGPSFRRRVR